MGHRVTQAGDADSALELGLGGTDGLASFANPSDGAARRADQAARLGPSAPVTLALA